MKNKMDPNLGKKISFENLSMEEASILALMDENKQLREDIDYLAAERADEKKRCEKAEEELMTVRALYESEADTVNDLAMEVARLNKVLKMKGAYDLNERREFCKQMNKNITEK